MPLDDVMSKQLKLAMKLQCRQYLEKTMLHTKGFRCITMSSSALDLVALSNEALSISIPHRKSIIEKKYN